MKRESEVNRKLIFSGHVVRLRCDDVIGVSGAAETREVVEHNGGVGVLPIDGDSIVLVRQFRYALGMETLEIPAGKLEQGEQPIECGIRELSEETGASGEVEYLTKIAASPGYCTEFIYIFTAKNLKFYEQHPDDGEDVEIVRIPISRALEMIDSEEIFDSKTVTAILLAKKRRLI